MTSKAELDKFHKNTSAKVKKLADDERGIKILLESVRKLFYEYQLVGDIEITQGASVTEATLSCEVDGTGLFVPDPSPAKDVKINHIVDSIAEGIIALIVMGVDKLINDLICRSKAYWDRSYRDQMKLAGSFSWSDPKGFFTTTIGCSATIESMHDYLLRNNEFELTYGFLPDMSAGIAP
mmetsp:Transcript_65577/g.128941  ORF Transcript_65577/g.128941 Transcript_65577/m.128941 type:complete len:180 (+) Transcript_65577:36-575(+)